MSNPDISKIISLIMENPQLVEQISNLAKSSENEPTNDSVPVESTPASAEAVPASAGLDKRNSTRTQLLRAMKPYLSESRGRAIDSMLSISGILDAMKRG